MNQEDATREATECNRESGAAGRLEEYWIEVEVSPGVWEVQRREEKGLLRRIFDVFMASPGP